MTTEPISASNLPRINAKLEEVEAALEQERAYICGVTDNPYVPVERMVGDTLILACSECGIEIRRGAA